MPMTIERIVEEARQWPPERVEELLWRLNDELRAAYPAVEAAWKNEIDRRVQDIQLGKVEGIPLEDCLARVRKIAGY